MAATTAQRDPVKCALPNCPRMFVPRTKVNKYCSEQCKKRGVAHKRMLRL